MPGLLIYVVSYQFVSRSIESWFDVKVEGALAAGVNLARVSLDRHGQLTWPPRRARPVPRWPRARSATRGWRWSASGTSWGPPTCVLWSAAGQPIGRRRGSPRFSLNPERPSAALLRSVRGSPQSPSRSRGWTILPTRNAVQMARVKVRWCWSANPGWACWPEPRFLQATLPLPPALVSNAIAVQEANREYQERALARGGLRRMYMGTLTLSLFLAVFGAVLLAVVLGNQLARPLLVLADGVREVAAGNLTPRPRCRPRMSWAG